MFTGYRLLPLYSAGAHTDPTDLLFWGAGELLAAADSWQAVFCPAVFGGTEEGHKVPVN